jgi:hypothetical protein
MSVDGFLDCLDFILSCTAFLLTKLGTAFGQTPIIWLREAGAERSATCGLQILPVILSSSGN